MSTAGPWGDPPTPDSRWDGLVGSGVPGLITEVLERYVGEWRRLVTVTASIVVPAAILQSFFTRDVEVASPAGLDPATAPTDVELAAMSTLVVVGVVVAAIVTPLLNGLLLRAAAERDTEIRGDLGDLYRTASTYFVPLLGLLVLMALGAAIGFLVFVIPGIYLAVRLYLAPAAMIVEGETISGALVRSWRLTGGAFWRCFGTIAFGVVAVLMLSITLSIPLMLVDAVLGSEAWLLQGILNGALSAVLWPFLMVLTVVLYLHRRIEAERLTPTVLAAELVAHETRG